MTHDRKALTESPKSGPQERHSTTSTTNQFWQLIIVVESTEIAFLQRASEEASTRCHPEFPRREHAHDVETQGGGAMRHFRSRFGTFCHEFIISKQYSQAQEIEAGLGFVQKSIRGV